MGVGVRNGYAETETEVLTAMWPRSWTARVRQVIEFERKANSLAIRVRKLEDALTSEHNRRRHAEDALGAVGASATTRDERLRAQIIGGTPLPYRNRSISSPKSHATTYRCGYNVAARRTT